MRKMGWMFPLVVLAAVGCQKSPGLFDERPDRQPETEPAPPTPEPGPAPGEPGTYGDQQGDPYGNQQGADQGAEGTPGMGEGGMGQDTTQQGGMGQDGMGQGGMGQDGMQPGQLGQVGDMPPQIRTLQENVQEIRTAENFQHTDLVQSLRDLSNAFSVLPNADTQVTDAVSRINSYADRIEAAGATSNMHGRWAKRALTEAVGALEAYQKAQNVTGFDQTVQTLTSQIDTIQDDVPFTDQKAVFADSYEQVTNALAMAAKPQDQIQRGTE